MLKELMSRSIFRSESTSITRTGNQLIIQKLPEQQNIDKISKKGCKYAGMHVGKYASMQVCWYAGMQVCKYVSMQVCKYASRQVCKYTRMCRYSTF